MIHNMVQDSQYIDNIKMCSDRGQGLKLAKNVAFDQRYIVPKGGVRVIDKLGQIFLAGFNSNNFTGSSRGSGVTPSSVITCKIEHACLFEILNERRDDEPMSEIQPVDKSITVARSRCKKIKKSL